MLLASHPTTVEAAQLLAFGAALKIKASKAPKFTAGATLKATVSGKKT